MRKQKYHRRGCCTGNFTPPYLTVVKVALSDNIQPEENDSEFNGAKSAVRHLMQSAKAIKLVGMATPATTVAVANESLTAATLVYLFFYSQRR